MGGTDPGAEVNYDRGAPIPHVLQCTCGRREDQSNANLTRPQANYSDTSRGRLTGLSVPPIRADDLAQAWLFDGLLQDAITELRKAIDTIETQGEVRSSPRSVAVNNFRG